MDRGYDFLCFLLVLAALVQSGLGQGQYPGTIHIYNDAAGTLTRQMSSLLNDGTHTSDPEAVPFPPATEFVYQVLSTEEYVYTTLHLTSPEGKHEQGDPIVWSEYWGGFLSCMPDCYIVIDNEGFWQASSAHSQLSYYWGWQWGSAQEKDGYPDTALKVHT